ncbi:MAG TPA: sodium/proton-translocating pyrophosphatase, partial [bacterium]|nr:sodium/proton-translocating pyrophosphatase [bacterium]
MVMVVFSWVAVKLTVKQIDIFWALLVGLLAGLIIGLTTEYYTSDARRPVREVAQSSKTGSATNIISGFSLGLMSTTGPVLTVVAAIILAYKFGGIYGVAVAAVGLLSTLGITLATDSYGPVADNAAGLAEMAKLGPEIRLRAEELDAVGNTTAAIGKGFSIGSAALTALVLMISFGQAVNLQFINLLDVNTIAGLFIGGLLPFIFSALVIKAIGRAAGQMVEEVRRQFRETVGIMEGTVEPDYNRCIAISTSSAQRQMILPGLLAVLAPVVVGRWLGAASLAGLLAGSIVSGFLLAVFMANAGGAWDNAKKYIEAGNHGGKGSAAHRASIVGDMVGDPLKDAAGPALNILIKLMAIVSIIIAPLLII